jgi:hypothetical protein
MHLLLLLALPSTLLNVLPRLRMLLLCSAEQLLPVPMLA